MTQPPYLRRDPASLRAAQRRGRRALLGALSFLVALIVVVVLAVVLVGQKNSGVKIPPSPRDRHSVPVSTP